VTKLVKRPDLVDLAKQINHEHQEAEGLARRTLDHVRKAGELLLEAKGKVPHGQWLPWLEANVKASVRTCQTYMRVAERWGELEAKAQSPAHLTMGQALDMLARTVEPEPIPLVVMTPEPHEQQEVRYVQVQADRETPPPAVQEEAQFLRVVSPPPPLPKHPYSDTLISWMRSVAGQTHQIQIEMGGIETMLDRRGKWDWKEVKNYLLPMLGDLEEAIRDFRQKIQGAADKSFQAETC
jgi:hypothetical protein